MQHANKNLDLTHSHDLQVRGERSDIEIELSTKIVDRLLL